MPTNGKHAASGRSGQHTGEYAQVYESHLWEDVLPWWLKNAVDSKHGGVFTFWNTDGTVLHSSDKYTWSQGRWIWTMMACAQLAKCRPHPAVDPARLEDLARTSAEFLWAHGMLGEGRVANFLTREGTPTAGFTGTEIYASVFADLFAALGFAALGRSEGLASRNVWAGRAEDLLICASDRIDAGHALTAPYPVPGGYRAFAPQMILVNTATEVYRATGSDRSRNIVLSSVRAILDGFVDGADICELSGPAAQQQTSLYARHRNPGHALEALWFLRDAADAVPGVTALMETSLGQPLDTWLVDAALLAIERGWDAECGGVLRFVDVEDGQPRGEHEASAYWEMIGTTWDYKLWWPHTEALYTLFLLHERTGDPRIWTWFRTVHEFTFGRFPAGAGNEWKQILNRAGEQLETDAGSALPVKDPFHLMRSLVLLASVPDRRDEEPR